MAFIGLSQILKNISDIKLEIGDSSNKLTSGERSPRFSDDLVISLLTSAHETKIKSISAARTNVTSARGILIEATNTLGSVRGVLIEALDELKQSLTESEANRGDNITRAQTKFRTIDTLLAAASDKARKLIDDRSTEFPPNKVGVGRRLQFTIGTTTTAFNNSAPSKISVTAESYTSTSLGLIGSLPNAQTATINAAITTLETALGTVRTGIARYGADGSRLKSVETQQVEQENTLNETFNQLKRVDLTKETIRFQALQLQQSLADFALREVLTLNRNQIATLLRPS